MIKRILVFHVLFLTLLHVSAFAGGSQGQDNKRQDIQREQENEDIGTAREVLERMKVKLHAQNQILLNLTQEAMDLAARMKTLGAGTDEEAIPRIIRERNVLMGNLARLVERIQKQQRTVENLALDANRQQHYVQELERKLQEGNH